MKKQNNFILALIFTAIAILLFFLPNIYGYFRFKSYCSSEGGLHVYERLERNVGWLADDFDDAHMASQLKYVGFVRYTDKKHDATYDLKYIGKDPQSDSSFEKILADESKKVKYKWIGVSDFVDNEVRLKRFGEKIIDLNSGKVMATYYMFSYSEFDMKHTILGAPSRNYCFLSTARSIGEIDEWITALNTAFKD